MLKIQILVLFLFASQLIAASPEWLYTKACVYKTNYDSAIIMLEGHDRIYLDDVVYYSNRFNEPKSPLETDDSLVYDQASQWLVGKKLSIAYSAETGAVLLDPDTGKYCEIIEGLKKHPLDALHAGYVGEGSTASVVVGASKVIELWKLEIQRIYNRLRSEFPDHVTEFNDAEASWEAFYADHLKGLKVANDKRGSVYSNAYAEEHLKLVSDFAKGLARWGRY